MDTGPDDGEPPQDPSRAERSRDLERLITFVDAVVAIAITLLVLPLVDLSTGLGGGDVTDLLRSHATQLFGFLLSFVVIADLWLDQHRALRSLVLQDRLVTTLLMAWTLTIVVLPFPTSLVAEAGHQPAAKVFYIGTMAVSSALLAVICWAIGRDRSIRDSDEAPDPARPFASSVLFLVALGLSLWVPALSYYPLLLLFLAQPSRRLWRHWRPVRPASVSAAS